MLLAYKSGIYLNDSTFKSVSFGYSQMIQDTIDMKFS